GGIVSTFPYIDPVLPYRGKGRGGVRTDGKIVKSYDAHGFRDSVPQLLALDQSGISDRVLPTDDAGDPHVQKAGKMPVHTFGEEERASGKRRGIVQPV